MRSDIPFHDSLQVGCIQDLNVVPFKSDISGVCGKKEFVAVSKPFERTTQPTLRKSLSRGLLLVTSSPRRSKPVKPGLSMLRNGRSSWSWDPAKAVAMVCK